MFNPFGLFHGVFIPEALIQFSGLSPGAKIAYGRLVRYAGQDGACHPRQTTLAREIGVTDRQVRSYIGELTTLGFLRVVRKGLHAPNEYFFLWHPIFNGSDRKEVSAQDRKLRSHQDRNETSAPIPRESREENQVEENHSSSSIQANQKTPPPTPSSASTPASESSNAIQNDDDAPIHRSVEYASERQELIALIQQASGQIPDEKLLSDILDRLKLRDVSLRAYMDDVRPRLKRLRRRAGLGFFYTMASEPSRSSPARGDIQPSLPNRCVNCSGLGRTAGGQYCGCQMGRDLAIAEKPRNRKKVTPEVAG